jgi:aspartyl-tRNA(Asn)/glutamyl-tRNA(Gln) amidotransferase subunit A
MAMRVHFETISEVGKRLRSGEITSTALTELMLDRIEAHNDKLNAFITVTADLGREQARQADEELSRGQDRGPLHGIPVAVKDLFATKGIRTTCGSKLFEDWVPDHDATAVKRLREAGTVLLGKTGLHELASGATSINPFFGAIANPWAPDHDPGGSSGGSASAVAAGLAYAALGSDSWCSIRQPAHCCSIVGHKPTFGLVSKAGALPLVWTMDHVGPLTRSVQDAASVLDAIAGYDQMDPYSVQATISGSFDASEGSIKGARVGIVRRHFFDGHSDVIEVVDAALETLSEGGADLVELDIPDIDDAFAAVETTFVEATVVYEQHLRERPHAFSDEARGSLEWGLDMKATAYAEAQHFRRGFTARLEQLMSECDVLVAPTATIAAAPIADRPADYERNAWKNTSVFNLTGHPSVSVPCGFTQGGLPVGLMITGRLFEDNKVLQFANAFERATEWHKRVPVI